MRHEVFTDISDHCLKELKTRDSLKPRNERAIATLESQPSKLQKMQQVLVPRTPTHPDNFWISWSGEESCNFSYR